MIDLFSFVALCLVLALRAGPLFRLKMFPGPAMWSVFIGAIALICRGIIVPAAELDAVLGGVNRLHLVRNLLVVMAVWCLRRAVADERARTREAGQPDNGGKPRILPVVGLMAAFSLLFSLEETGPTTATFIPQYVHLDNIWAYASIYMLGIGLMALDIVRLSRGRFRSYMGFFAAGGSLMASSSAVELAYMWLIHFDQGSTLLRDALYLFFQVVFYLGIALIALGLNIRPVDTAWSIRLRFATARLAGAVLVPGGSGSLVTRVWTTFWVRHVKDAAYDLLVQVRDLEIEEGAKFPPRIQTLIRNVAKYFDAREAAIPEEIVPTNG